MGHLAYLAVCFCEFLTVFSIDTDHEISVLFAERQVLCHNRQ